MPPRRILIVEDDSFLAKIYAKAFEADGFDVGFASTGSDGIKLAQRDVPDFLLLDLNMQPVNGFEVLQTLKADAATANIPIFVLTNLSTREDVQRCLELGAIGYAIKAHTLPREVVMKAKEILHVDL